MVGKTLSHYEILAPLGAGGMGEVYRARDTKLEREVAIKVLPDDLAADPDRLARFEREAKLLAALSHTNIGSIYGLDESDGVRFLVLELIDGETLEQRLRKGAIPVPEALDIARQIAEALEAAHDEGIIHRDVKPANVLLTAKGGVKVLDFGIAKNTVLAGGAAGNAALTEQATSLTIDGTLMGTPPYMAPEQIRGEEADERADIWAFGCVTYEMLTGRGAFVRETVADTLVAVLEVEPDWGALPGATPRSVRSMLRRALRKDPNRRLHHIADARIEVEETPGADDASEVSEATTLAPGRGVSLTVTSLVAVAACVLGAVVATLWLGSFRSRPLERVRSPLRFDVGLPAGTDFSSTGRHAVAFSPTGDRVVFAANDRLWVHAMEDAVAVEMNGPGLGSRSPFFSPDGRWVGFYSEGELSKVSIDGGKVERIAPASFSPFGVSWGVDGSILVGAGAQGIFKVAESGGELQPVVAVEEGEEAHGPQVLPGGEWLLYTLKAEGDSWDDAQVFAYSLRTQERKLLIPRGRDARYLPTGHLVYAVGKTLVARTFDLQSMEPTGTEVALVQAVRDGRGFTGASQFSTSSVGDLVYLADADPSAGWSSLVWIDRQGKETAVVPTPVHDARYPRVSPLGNRIAYAYRKPGEPEANGLTIGILDLVSGIANPLTQGTSPLWTIDGERVLFRRGGTAARPENRGVYSLGADFGLQDVTLALVQGDGAHVGDFHPSGDVLLFQGRPHPLGVASPETANILKLTPTEQGNIVEPYLSSGDNNRSPAFSPGGAWVAYVSDEYGQDEVWVTSFPDAGARRRISIDGGFGPLWSPSGQEIFYRDGTHVVAVRVATSPDFRVIETTELFEDVYRRSEVPEALQWDIHPEGDRFVMLKSVDEDRETPPPRLRFVFNWFEELERLVPTGRQQ